MGSSTDQMTAGMRIGMQYGLPVIIFICSSQFASVYIFANIYYWFRVSAYIGAHQI